MNAPSVQAITTASAPAPVGPYNQAVLAGGWLYCSGQIALDPTNGVMVGQGDVEAETRQVLSNLLAVLTAAGAEARQVIRTRFTSRIWRTFKGLMLSMARSSVMASAPQEHVFK